MARSLNPVQYLLGCQGLALLRGWLRPSADEELLESTRALAQASFAPLQVEDYSAAACYRLQQETYDAGWNELIAVEEQAVRQMIPAASGQALDAGCGTGRHAIWLAEQGYQVTAVDASAEMLEVARSKRPDITWRAGSLEALPVESAAFDIVVCALTLALCEDIGQPIAELARAARPGALVVISDVHPVSVMLGGSLLYETPAGHLGVTQQHVRWPGQFIDAFNSAGLRLRRCLDLAWPPPLWGAEWYAAAGDQRDTSQLMGDISTLALAGVPAASVWELEKR